MQKPMTEYELDELMKGITDCFSPTAAHDSVERTDFLARTAARLAVEVRRLHEAERARAPAPQLNRSASHWTGGVPLRESGISLSEELKEAISPRR